MDTTFSALMSATISAPEDSHIDHEYPFETSEHKEIARKINGVRTSFTVELGRIATEIEQTYETKTAAERQYTHLQSSIVQTAQSITASVAATYETKNAATQMEQRLNSNITSTWTRSWRRRKNSGSSWISNMTTSSARRRSVI